MMPLEDNPDYFVPRRTAWSTHQRRKVLITFGFLLAVANEDPSPSV
jgi:hypothetical protein